MVNLLRNNPQYISFMILFDLPHLLLSTQQSRHSFKLFFILFLLALLCFIFYSYLTLLSKVFQFLKHSFSNKKETYLFLFYFFSLFTLPPLPQNILTFLLLHSIFPLLLMFLYHTLHYLSS